ncbi:MAG: hypothetical protein IJ438_05455 [Clostridia bacterium]|nr:hypothetical protein [Clostridia bacterium]
MKKLLSILLVLMLLVSSACAEMLLDGDYMVLLPRAQVFVTPPEGGICLTRESSASVFNRLGWSQHETVAWMEENDVYALLYDADFTAELQLIIYETDMGDLAELSDFSAESLCAQFRTDWEDWGYDVEDVSLYRSAGHEYIRAQVSCTYADGTVERMVEYFTCQNGYGVQLMVHSMAEEGDAYLLAAEEMADSLWCMPAGGYVSIAAEDIEVLFIPPEDMELETYTGSEICAELTAPDGTWSIRWRIFGGVSGDMDWLSESGARALCEDRAADKKESGCTVELSEVYEGDMHRYVHTRYTETAQDGTVRYVDEYYTKQTTCGVIVEAYSESAPLPQEALDVLYEIVSTQMIDTPTE